MLPRLFNRRLQLQRCSISTYNPNGGPRASAGLSLNLCSGKFVATARTSAESHRNGRLPEVIVIGRTNVGKSTLLNALLGQKIMGAGMKAGDTLRLNFSEGAENPQALMLVDAIGYGLSAREKWTRLLDRYVHCREELRCVYVVIPANEGVEKWDFMVLKDVSRLLLQTNEPHPWTIQPVITKADRFPKSQLQESVNGIFEDIRRIAPVCHPPIVTSARGKSCLGIDQVRKHIINSCGYGEAINEQET